MRIEIERFGPIKKFTYDLEKDLIITYGNNNIGKSYSMQIVYLLLKNFLRSLVNYSHVYKDTYFFSYLSFDILKKELRDLLQNFLSSEMEIKDITEVFTQEVYTSLGKVFLPEFLNSCKNTFGNFDKMLEQTPIIKVNCDKFKFEINLEQKEMRGMAVLKTVKLKKAEKDFYLTRKYEKTKNNLCIYVISDIESSVAVLYEQIQSHLMECIQSVSALFEDVYFLPASRSGIYSGMNSFGSIVAELSKNRSYFSKEIQFPGISEPISDYFITLSNIKSEGNQKLSEYYTEIENEILKGKVTFHKTRNALMYKPQNMDVDFEMTEVSSMVSEISPIVAFLKYILSSEKEERRKKKSVLFIEEPEAHLHPNNQIALIEIFTKIINSDVKLIMSSHSNYIFNKLNNLVLGAKLDYRVYQPILLLEEEGGSRSKTLSIDELGAEDENFIDVSEKLYYEREEIIQKLNMEE